MPSGWPFVFMAAQVSCSRKRFVNILSENDELKAPDHVQAMRSLSKPSDFASNNPKFWSHRPMETFWYTATAFQTADLKSGGFSVSFPKTLTKRLDSDMPLCKLFEPIEMIKRSTVLWSDFIAAKKVWTNHRNKSRGCPEPYLFAIKESYHRAGENYDEIAQVSGNNWMHVLATKAGHMKFRDLLLPGSHDSGCWPVPNAQYPRGLMRVSGFGQPGHYITQRMRLFKQLEFGVRILDLRWKRSSAGIFHIAHAPGTGSAAYFQPYDAVARELAAWCDGKGKSETVFLRMKSYERKIPEWVTFLQDFARRLGDRALPQNRIPSDEIGDVNLRDWMGLVSPTGRAGPKCKFILMLYQDDDVAKKFLANRSNPYTSYNKLFSGKYGAHKNGEKSYKNQYWDMMKREWIAVQNEGNALQKEDKKAIKIHAKLLQKHSNDKIQVKQAAFNALKNQVNKVSRRRATEPTFIRDPRGQYA